ncbi:sulfur carrier protein ThiS [Bartonella krasnovii]|uniref:Sulfur carrier protein ThiS n=1 Tax=Bartonella krasnovii TaxID=2267275 RepID=A0A5B9CZT0_9HYPH|nr:sulfur carrier protein ThiS [Bartonella krasnovii]QEE11786.1 sulfur carrier protein ThiS [Bartonella krasnovii]UNF29546.1 sulfur carrier protein ThiS [Bartonella krasnovii]UNF35904.1 sulfur carrier protein ThiS [Bartonella krasnovii]UNF37524.1 sulfur carrier protein ThiS [Bartonella krasnovii]UNF39308.1 sulfur carrier protein ThiS [Bartonella krasnovii]
MQIFVNGEKIQTEATSLNLLLVELGYEGNWLATAVNAEVVPVSERSQFVLHEGDKIEVLSPMQGG